MSIALTDSNNEVLKKYKEVWSRIKDQIKKINNGKLEEYEKDCIKIKFNSDDNLSLNEHLTFFSVSIIVTSVFKKVNIILNFS